MEPVVVWQHKWSADLFIPGYLFFGGLTGGLAILAAVADLAGAPSPRVQRVARAVALAAVVTLAVAGVLLTTHLGKPERGLGFPVFFTNYTSWMTRGGWVLGVTAPLVVAYGALWYFGVSPGIRRVVAGAIIPLGALLSLYTGFLLSSAGYVPLWSRSHLPPLFLTSGLTGAVAVAGLLSVAAGWLAREPTAGARRVLGVALVVLLAVEAYELRSFMHYLAARAPDKTVAEPEPTGEFRAPAGSRLAWEYVTGGPEYPWALLRRTEDTIRAGGQWRPTLAAWFWVGVVGLGLALPAMLTVAEGLLEVTARGLTSVCAAVKFASALAGGFMLRVVVVWGGDLKAPLPFPPQLFQVPQALGPLGVGG
jgi:formate-dependent nitrite reductase membrane component NrfD